MDQIEILGKPLWLVRGEHRLAVCAIDLETVRVLVAGRRSGNLYWTSVTDEDSFVLR